MALKPVQDPNLLAALEAPETPAPAAPKAVTDPALLAQLEAPEGPAAPLSQVGADEVPTGANLAATKPQAAPAPSLWDRAKSAVEGDPIIDMWMSSLPTVFKGAPEVAGNMVGNAGVQAVAGLTAPFVSGGNMDDAANFVQDFTAENSMRPQGEAAQELTGALGEAFAPMENVKNKLGDTTLGLTGSPDAAATASMAPDFLATLLGVTRVAKNPPPLKPDAAPVNSTVESLRAADIRLRPSDVRAMEPKAPKIPGERRERFADAPDLKKDLTLHNQGRFTDLAAEELGVKKLDEASFEEARKAPGATYDMVENVLRDREMSPAFVATFREAAASAKLAKGEGYSVTRIIGALRRRAAKRMQSDNVQTEEAGFADRELADKLEEQLGRELEAAGEPQLFKQYQDARQQFAKINDTETATRAGQVDANVLYKLGQKGVKLSGRLKLIADAFENAPNVTGHSLKTAARAGDEIASSREGIIKEFLKAGIRKIPGMDVGSARFQDTLGRADPVATANYGRRTEIAPPRGPEQGELDIREALGLEMAPGEVGKPARELRDLGPQEDMLGSAFEFEAPGGAIGRPARPARGPGAPQDMFGSEFEFELAPGNVGIPPEPQLTLQELLGLGEPLALKKSPGRVGGKSSRGSAPAPAPAPAIPQDLGDAVMRPASDAADAKGLRMSAVNEPDLSTPARSETQNQAAALLDAISNPASRNPRAAVSKAADALALRAAELPRPARLALQNLREVMAESKASPGELLDAYDELSTMLRQYIGE